MVMERATSVAIAERGPATSTEARGPDWARALSSRWMLLGILAVAALVYVPTLADWFTNDDFWFLRAAQTNSIGHYALNSFDPRETGARIEFDRYRPLYPIVWRLEYALFGLHAAYYHAVVVALHLGCTVLAWFIARRLFAAAWAANLATLVFAVHPAYADAVAWISGGNRVFEMFPYLVSLLLFMQYRDRGSTPRLAGSFVAFVIAVLLHSSALTLAAVLPAYAFLIAGEPRDARDLRSWAWFVPFAAFALAETAVQWWVRGNLDDQNAIRFGVHQYATYASYLGLAAVPVQPANYSGTLGSLVSTVQGVATLAMIGLTFALLYRRPAWRVAIFAVFWLYVSLLPDSTLIFTTSGRVLYMPGLALAIFFVLSLIWVRDALPRRYAAVAIRVAPYALLAGLIPTLLLTYEHVRTTSRESAANERFASALRRDAATAPGTTTLYVVNAPRDLTLFDDSRLRALAQLYLPDLAVMPISQEAAAQLQLKAGERLFRYGS